MNIPHKRIKLNRYEVHLQKISTKTEGQHKHPVFLSSVRWTSLNTKTMQNRHTSIRQEIPNLQKVGH